jgi:hypothetical protein
VEFQEYDDMMRRMLAIVVKMDSTIDALQANIDELKDFNRQQGAINERLTAAIERLDITQARIETLLKRVLPPAENGREA